jgi:adenylate kinase family enzyme
MYIRIKLTYLYHLFIAGIVAEAIKGPECNKGFILDGFPRTVEQAKILDG